jgi:RNA-binding protein
MLTTKQIAFLRSQAHHLNPTVMIGQQGLTESIITKISNELEAHELIKVKFLEFKEQKRELSATIVEQTSCDLVTIIGNIAVLYREPRDLSRKKINLPV